MRVVREAQPRCARSLRPLPISSWHPLAGWERGLRYNPAAFMPVRRKSAAPQEAPAGTPGGASGTSAAASPASGPETASGAAAAQATTAEAAPGTGDEFTLEPDDGQHPEGSAGNAGSKPGQEPK